MAETLSGTIARITYRSDESGYTVLRLTPDNPTLFNPTTDDGYVTVVGVMPPVNAGEMLKIDGDWTMHPDYGKQFQAERVERTAPTSPEGIARYLAAAIHGVGKRTANAIVDHFGENTIHILDHQPERMYEVDGIGRYRVRQLIKGWAAQKDHQEVMLFLQGHGVSSNRAYKIYAQYGDDTIGVVQENPYQLIRDIFGFGFYTADQIAQDLGLPAEHPKRVEAGVAHILDEAANDGHVYLPEADLLAMGAEMLDVAPDLVQAAVDRAVRQEDLIRTDVPAEDATVQVPAVYLPMYFYAELGTANRIRRMVEHAGSRLANLQRLGLESVISDVATWSDISLTDQQLGAVKQALLNKVSILTGGPGTGKTTTLRTLIEVLAQEKNSFALASPTGRAAKRLSQATGYPASTIHRLLGYTADGRFEAGEQDPLNYDILVIDEASMLDTILANALFRAVEPRTHVLLVGDVDQLPSVGAGDVLRDIIKSGEVPVTRLKTIFRQGAGSTIVANAHRINEGEHPVAPEGVDDFFHFRIGDDAQRAADLVVDIVRRRIPDRFDFDPMEDIQVLVPMYRGPAGVDALNDALQAALNPKGRRAEKRLGDRLFRKGDKVIQLRNNYDKEVFNGDVGLVHAINKQDSTLTVAMEDRFVEYEYIEAAQQLTHAYAISVHRSQGSEYPVVVMPIITQHYMLLQRNLLYTAITRAKKLAVLVGSDKAISIAVRNDEVSQRFTALAERLRGEV